jgi:phenylalanyl-tRNA synthetase beta chain
LFNKILIAEAGEVTRTTLNAFGIKQPVYFASIQWNDLIKALPKDTIAFKSLPKFPSVERDLSIVVNKQIEYAKVEGIVFSCKIPRLTEVKLFDVFTSEKLGDNKKALALSFTFIDNDKTLVDKEIESMMNTLISAFETHLGAEIRK